VKQEDVAGKILIELMELGIVKESQEEMVYTYLCQAYAAGWVEGSMQYHKRKPVGQYSLEGKLLKIWESSYMAARHFDLDKTSISKAALGKTETCAGFRWRYINVKDPNASKIQTIGSMKSKSIQPRQRTHFSKKD
jgi:hypothetical protein